MGREMFDVYKHKVVINTRLGAKEFELLPLSGRYYKKLMGVALKLKGQGEEVDLSKLDEETIGKLHELCFETLKYSEGIKDEDKEVLEKIDLFVSQNLMQIIPAVLEVNMDNQEE